MSFSNKNQQEEELVEVIVDADDPSTEIFIIDGNFNRIDNGLGRLEVDLPPGLYKVKFKAGSLIEELFMTLEPGIRSMHVPAPEMAFSS